MEEEDENKYECLANKIMQWKETIMNVSVSQIRSSSEGEDENECEFLANKIVQWKMTRINVSASQIRSSTP